MVRGWLLSREVSLTFLVELKPFRGSRFELLKSVCMCDRSGALLATCSHGKDRSTGCIRSHGAEDQSMDWESTQVGWLR